MAAEESAKAGRGPANFERHLKTAPADLLLQPPVEDWDTLDFRRVRPIAEAGYQFAAGPVRDWWAQQSAGSITAPPEPPTPGA